MSLPKGTRLGPYEILAPLGAGGMGEVYRARDERLARDVAVKVVRSEFASDPDRLRRFEAEARAAGQLNHPNILSIYDVGTHQGSPYIVSELLEGETLRERLEGGPLTARKSIDLAGQIAEGLAAAHEKGIVHRDLKPENLFVTRDERVKILDFGLAKLKEPRAAGVGLSQALTGPFPTEPGVVLGTMGYMSPEQVRGHSIDHRADIFSFGAIVHEMVSGKRAFRGESPVETMNAILKDEPAELAQTASNVPPGLERIVRRCLEKRPEVRWHEARDLAFALDALAAPSVTSVHGALVEEAKPRARQRRVRRVGLAVGLAALSVLIIVAVQTGRVGRGAPLSFQRLTFTRGTIWSARFAPEGRTIIYSATWDGTGVELFSTRPDSPESRSLGIAGADVGAISPSGEMALLLKPGSFVEWAWKWGTLARASLASGAPRESLQSVQLADWGPDATSLAVVRMVGTESRLEFPIGNVLYETPERIGALRVSPKGDIVALAERPPGLGSNWTIAVLDVNRRKQPLSGGWAGDFIDLAWSPAGDEIWFDTRQGGDNGLHAVTLSGRHRWLAQLVVPVQLFDVARDGRLLLARLYWRSGIIGVPPGESEERDLSWLDASEVDDISYDGRSLLITEFGEGGGAGRSSVYLRTLDGSPAVRLGDGQAFALSPDGARALSLRRTAPPEIVLWPIGAGDPIVLKNPDITDYAWADWLPDGKRIFFNATERGHGPRCYVQELETGKLQAVTPEGTTLIVGQEVISPDGEWAAVIAADGRPVLYPIGGGDPRLLPGVEAGDVPIRWSADEQSLFVFRKIQSTPGVYLIDLSTGRAELWKEIMPADPAGITNVWAVHIAPDEKSYYYSYMRNLSDLYLVEGVR